jgi:hypothetical protein
MSNPDLPPGEQPKLSPLAQTFELIKPGGYKVFKLPEPVPSDWPVDVKMRWYPLFRLLKSPYFTEIEIGRLIRLKSVVQTK